jgi:hypothetical protein
VVLLLQQKQHGTLEEEAALLFQHCSSRRKRLDTGA